MPSLVKQLENKTYKKDISLNQSTLPEKSTKKKQTALSQYLPFAVSIPVFTAAGGYVGYDCFEREKQSLKKTLNVKVDENIQNFRNKVLSSFSDLVLRIKENRPTEMPNCLLVKGKDSGYCERMINWIGKTGNADFISINVGDDILEQLEKAENNFQKSKNWTLMYIKNMDTLINHSQSEDHIVEGMKDIMSAASEDYHTTIIFSTDNPKKLDKIALQPHRVKKVFDIDEIKETKFFETDEIIRNWNKNNDKYQQMLNGKGIKNKKIAKYSAIGLLIGALVALGINQIKKLLNKRTN